MIFFSKFLGRLTSKFTTNNKPHLKHLQHKRTVWKNETYFLNINIILLHINEYLYFLQVRFLHILKKVHIKYSIPIFFFCNPFTTLLLEMRYEYVHNCPWCLGIIKCKNFSWILRKILISFSIYADHNATIFVWYSWYTISVLTFKFV